LYIYQGDELGLPEVEDLPADRLEDPMHFRSGGVDPGRDGCRVPLPWRGVHPPFGFSPKNSASEPWLPQPETWSHLTVEAEQSDATSMLWLYRQALRIRRAEAALGDGPLTWHDGPEGTLAFARGDRFLNVTNLSREAIALPEHVAILLSSSPLVGGLLPPDSTAWLRTQH
jgi:alpha-glucosidase